VQVNKHELNVLMLDAAMVYIFLVPVLVVFAIPLATLVQAIIHAWPEELSQPESQTGSSTDIS
jgi:cytochrome c oxidase assembly factor CtaG